MQKIFRWPTLIVLAVLLLAALVPTVMSISHATHAHASSNATLTLSAPTGQPGATIAVSGQSFAASTSVSLYLGSASGTLLGTSTTDSSGNLPSTNVTVPDQSGGAYGITAVQGTVSATAPFSIVPEISLPRMILFPGEKITLAGQGFGAQDFIDMYLDSTTNWYFVGVVSDSNGNISQSIALPGSYVLSGSHVLIARDDRNYATAQLPVTFLPHLFALVGHSGLTAQLQGAAFNANETVNVYWGSAQGQLEGTTTTDTYGNLSFSFTVPTGLTNGLYSVTVVRSQQKPAVVATNLQINPVVMSSTPGIHSGQTIKVRVSGFLANEQVTLSWNANGGLTFGYLYTDNHGAAQATFTPPFAPIGSYTLTASDNNGLQVSNSLNVGPGVSGGTGTPGGTLYVVGGGFSANEAINVYFQTTRNGVVSTTTNAYGAFSASVNVPDTYNPSVHYSIVAVNAAGTEKARAPYTFLTPTFSACYSSCNEVAYGQALFLTGNNFAYNEPVDIIWNYQQPGQRLLSVATGSYFNANAVVPSVPDQTPVVIAAIGEKSHIVLTISLTIDAAIYPGIDYGKAGASVAVTGGSFGPGDTITLSLAGQTVGTTTSLPDGTFSTTFTVPAITGAGNLTLTASDTTANRSANAPFYFVPVLKVNPSIVHNGDSMIITGAHFVANSQIYITAGSGFNQTFYANTNANGAFTISIPISGFQSGTNYAQASDGTSYLTVSAAFVVQ